MRTPPPIAVSSQQFVQALAADAALRDAFEAYLREFLAAENTLDRIDAQHSLDFQRGKVAAYRYVIESVRALERSKGDGNGSVQ